MMIPWWQDAGERVVRALLTGAGAAIIVAYSSSGLGQNIYNVNAWEKVGTAAFTGVVTAGLSLISSVVARETGSTHSASFVSNGEDKASWDRPVDLPEDEGVAI